MAKVKQDIIEGSGWLMKREPKRSLTFGEAEVV